MAEKKVFTIGWAYAIERELSHIVCDSATYDLSAPEVTTRIAKLRNNIRKAMQSAGYKGQF